MQYEFHPVLTTNMYHPTLRFLPVLTTSTYHVTTYYISSGLNHKLHQLPLQTSQPIKGLSIRTG